MTQKVRTTKRRRWIWYGLVLGSLLWAIWSGVFTLDPRLAAIQEDMAFLLRREAISPEELQWALDQVEAKNLAVVEAFLAERIALLKHPTTREHPIQARE